jgi:hypothetical protein
VSISSTFYVHFFHQYFGAKNLQSLNVIREKLLNLLSYGKCMYKRLMKLTPDCTETYHYKYFEMQEQYLPKCIFTFKGSLINAIRINNCLECNILTLFRQS